MRAYQFKTIPISQIPNNNRPIGSTSVQSSSINSMSSRVVTPQINPSKQLESSSKRLITEPTYANNLTGRLSSESVLRGRIEIDQQNKLNGEYLNVNNSNGRGNLLYTQPNNRSSTYRMSSQQAQQPTYSNQGRREYQVNENTKAFEQKTNLNMSLNQSAGAHSNMQKQYEANSQAVSLLQSKIKALEQQKSQLSKSVTNAKRHSQELETEWKSLKLAQQQQSNRLAKSIEHEEQLSQSHTMQMQRLIQEFQTRVRQIQEQRQNQEAVLKNQVKEMEQKIANLSSQSSQGSNLESFEVRKLMNELAIKEVQIQELEGQLGAKKENISLLMKNLEETKGEVKQLKELKEQMQKEKYEQFDEILITQMQSINELKQKIEGLNQNCFELKEKIIESERKNESLTNQISIMELRHKSQVKNLQLQSEIESHSKENTIDHLQKKMITMQEKYKMAVSEIKTKDEFFRQHLLGRTDQSDTKAYIVSILEKYQSTFRTDQNI